MENIIKFMKITKSIKIDCRLDCLAERSLTLYCLFVELICMRDE